jgi:hypothetical protein
VDGFAVHAAIVSRKIMRRDNGAGSDHRVGGKPAHPTF